MTKFLHSENFNDKGFYKYGNEWLCKIPHTIWFYILKLKVILRIIRLIFTIVITSYEQLKDKQTSNKKDVT